jgi:hypothetical protein
MVLTFILGSRCPGKGLCGSGLCACLREGGSLRECPHLKIEIWGTRICGYLVSRVRGFTFSRMKVIVVSSGVPGPKMAETPLCFNLG